MVDGHLYLHVNRLSCCCLLFRVSQTAAAAAGRCMYRLAEKIRAARVNKERSLQLQEKAALAAQEAEYDKVYDKVSSEPAIAQHQLPPSAAHHGCVYTAATCIFNM
jgi:hypothetical protein